QLANFCKVKQLAVSYAGLKDRHAVTSQWFSVQLPGKPTPDWEAFEAFFSEASSVESIRVLQSFRHNRKLQRGALKSNTFKITLRDLSDASERALQQLKQRCDDIAQHGVANYFGAQRFGRHLNNLEQVEKLFLKPRYKLAKHKRGLYLSAARSWLFNCILSERIKNNVWNQRLPGDVFMLDGKSACFIDELVEHAKLDICARLALNEIHPTAILWGQGDVMVTAQAAELEMSVIDQFPVFRDGLVSARLQAQRRACRLLPRDMTCYQQDNNFVVGFTLPPGSYATVVLSEIFSYLQQPDNNKVA
ncbi:MAG: tRNA pseudouridine(13) synthase TruD, partial [Gammaproteobacteria bacterium]|nr:tRNA pseudouridine(13) synthase TruD [Gammaproteobacteria bacterium]